MSHIAREGKLDYEKKEVFVVCLLLLFTIKIEGAKLFSFGVEAASFFLPLLFCRLVLQKLQQGDKGEKDWRLMETFARQLEEQGGRRSPFIFFATAYTHPGFPEGVDR